MQCKPATFDQRLLAQTLDITILFPVLLILDGLWPQPSEWFWVACLLIYHVYVVATEASSLGATPGKKMAGIAVISDAGGRPGLAAIVARNLAKWVSLLPISIGFFMIYFTKNSKALHDQITHTRVVVNAP